MYDNTELQILKQIYLNPGIHKREISKQLKLGMPSIDHGLKKITSLLKAKWSGNQLQYTLDYTKPAITPALYSVEYSRFEKLPAKVKFSVGDFLKELPEKPLLAIIFGSYAKNMYTKDSDIDILLVFQKLDKTQKIEDIARKVGMMADTKLNPVYIDYPTFKESFHNSTKKFFNNLKQHKILLAGIEWWRQLKDEET